MKVTKKQYKIKDQLIAGPEKFIIIKNIIYFIDYGKLNKIEIFINRYGEQITSLGYEFADTNTMYFQHLSSRYPEMLIELEKNINKEKNSFKWNQVQCDYLKNNTTGSYTIKTTSLSYFDIVPLLKEATKAEKITALIINGVDKTKLLKRC